LTVAVSSEPLKITGVKTGSSVALLGVARESGTYMTYVVSHRELLTDADQDGRIEYSPPHGIAFRSIWTASAFRPMNK